MKLWAFRNLWRRQTSSSSFLSVGRGKTCAEFTSEIQPGVFSIPIISKQETPFWVLANKTGFFGITHLIELSAAPGPKRFKSSSCTAYLWTATFQVCLARLSFLAVIRRCHQTQFLISFYVLPFPHEIVITHRNFDYSKGGIIVSLEKLPSYFYLFLQDDFLSSVRVISEISARKI